MSNILQFRELVSPEQARKNKQYELYIADIARLDLEIINAKIKLAKLQTEKKQIQVAGLNNYEIT